MTFRLKDIKTAEDKAAEATAAQAAREAEDARRLLAETDHEIIKAFEAQITDPALAPLIARRQAARTKVREA